MGNPASKAEEVQEEQHCSEGSIPSTPILTPKVVNKSNELDPRSPSENIIRTPLEFLTLSDLPHDDLVEGEEAFDALGDNRTSGIYTILNEDPRSPTTEFERTPIVVSTQKSEASLTKPFNKHLENVRNQDAIVRTPAAKLLESNPITNSTKQKPLKRKSFVGLLETNIDFTETDLDAVVQGKGLNELISKVEHVDSNSELIEELAVEQNVEVVSEEITEELKEVNLSHTVPKSDAEVQTDGTDVIIIPADLHLVNEKVIMKNNADCIKDFDKKLTNLIYEDDDSSEIAIKSATSSKEEGGGARTPLSERNFNLNQPPKKQSATKLKVSDKPRKSVNMSRIPILSKNNRQQCENTPPPRSALENRDQKRQQSHWDHDTTLII